MEAVFLRCISVSLTGRLFLLMDLEISRANERIVVFRTVSEIFTKLYGKIKYIQEYIKNSIDQISKIVTKCIEMYFFEC